MAGFAIPLSAVLRKPNAGFRQKVPRGYQESHILTELGTDCSIFIDRNQNYISEINHQVVGIYYFE